MGQGGQVLEHPKRILELKSDTIILRDDLLRPYSYACLSHCVSPSEPESFLHGTLTKSQWGKENIVPKTVAATLDQFKVGVPVDVLTKTFQDAIDICQRLEIEYLWIDSLCIPQDDEADWKDQASKMAGIYQNSILTIAATNHQNLWGGSTHDQNTPLTIWPTGFRYEN